MKQAGFSDLEYEVKKKQTRKEKFLAEMEEILPWEVLLGVVRRHYPKRGNGRPPIGLEPMVRIYFMQQWYGLSDPAIPAYVGTAQRNGKAVSQDSAIFVRPELDLK